MEKAIQRYSSILKGKAKPKFKLAKNLPEKIKQAYTLLEACELCERKCKVNRLKGELGWCKVGNKPIISSYFVHHGEEYFFVPSFTIFFWSCTFACQYCQNYTISQRFEPGTKISEKEIAKIIDSHAHCKNVNFVGGDPTPQLPFVLKILGYVKANLPVVWNSNFYMSEKSMSLLSGIIDVYLSDFKYGNDKCAERLSKVKNYTSVIKRNHLLAAKDAELVIRHLILPNHVECCSLPILKWIAEHLGEKVVVNIMSQYKPEYLAHKYEDINRLVSQEEIDEVIKHAKKLRLNFIT